VTGRRSNTTANITVNGSAAAYQGLYFWKEAANTPTPYGAGDVYEPVQVKEGTNTLTPDPDPLQFLGVPWRLNGSIPNPISYDVDGNLLTDGRWTYTWDGENRLISMSAPAWTQPAGPIIPGGTLDAITLSFRYDGLSRRISKKVTITTNGVATSTMEGYLYDGWNLVMITTLDPSNLTGETVQGRKWSCLWRPDVGSSLYARSSWQKAGGVGGLAWLQTGSAQNLSTGGTSGAIVTGTGEVHIPMADHMGNIRHYVHFRPTTSTGPYGSYTNLIVSQSANFEYDAFGREVRANGTTVAANPPPPAAPTIPPGLTAGTPYTDALPFHFSSKFTDPESGLNYYGYRFYDPKEGRWLGRDPVSERGGNNIYGFVFNRSTSRIDYLGLEISYPDVPIPRANDPDWDVPDGAPADSNHEGIECDGKGRARIKKGTGDTKGCCKPCVEEHEQSHADDVNGQKSNPCDGKPAGARPSFKDAAVQRQTEMKAYKREIDCYAKMAAKSQQPGNELSKECLRALSVRMEDIMDAWRGLEELPTEKGKKPAATVSDNSPCVTGYMEEGNNLRNQGNVGGSVDIVKKAFGVK
jgi:RHS repeat-associated protein